MRFFSMKTENDLESSSVLSRGNQYHTVIIPYLLNEPTSHSLRQRTLRSTTEMLLRQKIGGGG